MFTQTLKKNAHTISTLKESNILLYFFGSCQMSVNTLKAVIQYTTPFQTLLKHSFSMLLLLQQTEHKGCFWHVLQDDVTEESLLSFMLYAEKLSDSCSLIEVPSCNPLGKRPLVNTENKELKSRYAV